MVMNLHFLCKALPVCLFLFLGGDLRQYWREETVMRNETESGSAVNVRSGAHLVTGQQRVVVVPLEGTGVRNVL